MIASAHVDTFARDHLPPPALWPELLFELPTLQYPPRLNCAAELLASGDGAKPAILWRGGCWSRAELADKIDRIARVLVEDMGLVPGNRVLLRGANGPMLAACLLAVWKAGLIAVPTMPLLRAPELRAVIDKARIGAALCAAPLLDELERARGIPLERIVVFDGDAEDALERRMQAKAGGFTAVDTAAEDVCLIAFTSGTTGEPKGAVHFHRDMLAICDCFPRSTLAVQPDDVFIGTPPLAFTFGLGGLLLFPLRAGASAVLLEQATPESLLQAMQDFRATVCFSAPTFYRRMAALAPRYDLSTLKKSVSAGEALPAATRAAWKQATGIEMIDGIGSTEMLHIFISAAGADVRPGAIGRPIPGYRACVLDAYGRPLPPGQAGRLAVKGPTGCRYLDDARQRDYVHNGWNLTGDICEMDADGYFHYRGRSDDMIVSSGYNIAGPEVEGALLGHPAVAECAVVGWPDRARGQIAKAFVVLRPEAAPGAELARELQDFVKQAIAPYKYPRAIEFVAALPRTGTGKLQRFRLRPGGGTVEK